MERERLPGRTICAVLAAAVLASGCAGRLRPREPAGRPATHARRGRAQSFTVTAYCTGRETATGTRPTNGIIAADPAVLPMGSTIRIDGLDKPYNGVYRVMDTGSAVKGRQIDLYLRDCREAIKFGRRKARVSLLE